jgi:enoyl-CoA hydratase
MDLILTGRAVGAQEALQIGLANRVAPAGQALATVQGAARFAQGAGRHGAFGG